MGLRPGSCYSSLDERAYTRVAVKVHRRNYIGTTPGVKTRQFNMGNGIKEFNHILDLVVEEGVQIRDNALESARMAINRYLIKKLGKEGFFMKVRVYPHQILRENKQAQGAHADRIQKGMSHPFGRPIGRAVRVRKGQKIISVLCDEKNLKDAKTALLRAKSRLTCRANVTIGTDVKSIGTKPTKIQEIAEEKAEEAKEGEAEEKEKKEATKEGEEGKKTEKGKEAKKGAEEKKEGKAAEKGKEPAKEEKKEAKKK